MPGADPADFFNYGLNINTWKEYVARIHQFRLEFTMQKKIQTYESSNDTPALDSDLPPELAAAVAQGRQQVLLMKPDMPKKFLKSCMSATSGTMLI